MNKFFTRKWYEYIYSEMKDCLPKACYLRYMNNGDFFDKIITNDAEYDLDKIIIDKFEKYFTRKKNYIDSYLELEKKFGSYEKIDELNSYEEELDKYKNKLDFFVNNTKNRLELIINKLKKYNIVIEIDLNEEEFTLLGLNILKPDIRKKYMEVKRIYRENLNKYDDLTEEELENIDYIRNDVNAFLTCNTDYLANREDKFSDEINSIYFHDSTIVKYEKNGNDAILEIKEYGASNFLRRFTFKNVLINADIIDEKAYDLIDAKPYFDSGWVEIYGVNFGNYEDYNYYLKLFLPWKPGQTALSEQKEEVVVSFIADKISIENVVPYPLLTLYSRTSGNNMSNLEKYKDLLGEKEYKFFTAFTVDMYLYKDLKYINNDILINFESIMKPYDSFYIKFLDISFNMNKVEFKDAIEILKDNKIGPSCIRIVDYNNSRYEVGLLLSNEEEIIITCYNILFDGENCTLFEHNWIDLGKYWDMTYEKVD